jgi:hypothetical protein
MKSVGQNQLAPCIGWPTRGIVIQGYPSGRLAPSDIAQYLQTSWHISESFSIHAVVIRRADHPWSKRRAKLAGSFRKLVGLHPGGGEHNPDLRMGFEQSFQ